MGLLDDAIREHLELKRLKGADPGDVAREEQEALGEDGSSDQIHAGAYAGEHEAPAEPLPSGQDWDVETQGEPTSVAAAQETIELDMESVLASTQRQSPSPAVQESDVAGEAHARQAPSPEDSLEWEVPSEQDLGAGDEGAEESSEEEPAEDVLEETPDFLRETPEQDRLWFEQRPPRDFDFNE